MRLLVSWVRDFVDVTAPADQIADTLALRGFDVAAIEALDGDDAVIDFEVTANRPDCLSVLGLAREIGTAFDLPVRLPSEIPGSPIALAPVMVGESDRVHVRLEDADLCPRYAAAVADVVPGASPSWMTARLQAAGVRPISPIVDVTNYVLMELGHPMHAFDLEALESSTLCIRRAHAGERLTTLDGAERTLDPDMLVIADGRRAQAVAGVMGGGISEVSSRTRTVAFESAYFLPSSVRRTSKRLGLKTEASSRFERGADVNAPVLAIQRAVALMERIGAGRLTGPVVDRYPQPREPRHLHLRRARLDMLLGLAVPDAEVLRILTSLGLPTVAVADGWSVTAPTFRVDLVREVDLIEEVGRHYGLDKLDPTFPPTTAAAPPPDPRVPRDQLVRRVLTAAGLSEAITFGFIEAQAARTFAPAGDVDQLIGVANPLSAKFDVLRPSLLSGLLDSVAHNRRHGQRDVALFEIGARFTRAAGETRGVGLAWTGMASPEHWSGSARECDLFDLTGTVGRLCEALGALVRFETATVPFLMPGQTAAIRMGEAVVGLVGQLLPAVVDRAGAPRHDKIVVAELDLDALQARRTRPLEIVHQLPRHPAVVRDLSIVVSRSLPAAIIRDTIQAAGDSLAAPLVSVTFFDRYQGKGIPDGSVSLSARVTFQAPDRTLTDPDVQQAFDMILAALQRAHGAVQR